MDTDRPGSIKLEADFVAEIDPLKDRRNIMESIRPFVEDPQEKIHFGR